jgi:hypothetical protein
MRVQESNVDAAAPSWAARARQCVAAALLAITQCHTDKSDDQLGLVASESYRGGMHLLLLQSKGATERSVDLSACGNRSFDHHWRWRNFRT